MNPNDFKKGMALVHEAESGAADERHGIRKVVRALRGIEDTRFYLHLGYPSLFAFCTKKLKYSEREANLRIRAVKKVAEVPELLPAIEEGRLTLSNLAEMAHMLHPGNVKEVIALFTDKTKLEAQEIVAKVAPKPPQKSGIRKMPTPKGSPGPQRPQERITPHALDLYKFVAMIDGELFAAIQELFALMMHMNPGRDPAVLLRECVKALRAQYDKKHFGSPTPRKTKPSKDPAYVNGATKREVWKRDNGQCAFVGKGGLRCSAREFLEVHHVVARAHGGDGSATNMRLLCRAHHQLETERTFGREFTEKKIALRKAHAKAKTKSTEPKVEAAPPPRHAPKLPKPKQVKKATPHASGAAARKPVRRQARARATPG